MTFTAYSQDCENMFLKSTCNSLVNTILTKYIYHLSNVNLLHEILYISLSVCQELKYLGALREDM